MGKLGSFTQEEMDRKKSDNKKLVEIWQKTVQVQQAKKQLHCQQELLVDVAKLPNALALTNDTIRGLNDKLHSTVKSDESADTRPQTVQDKFDNIMKGANSIVRQARSPVTPSVLSIKRNTSTTLLNRNRNLQLGDALQFQQRSNSLAKDKPLAIL